jgi:prevent-host-death family protein
MTTIGLRELRQNASKWVELAASGESIEITNRGVPVAVLGPKPTGTVYEQLVARGEITPATGRLEDVEPLPAWDGPTASEVLQELRDSERY